MLSFDEAQALLQTCSLSPGIEQVPIAFATGRVLAEDIYAQNDQPPFDRTTMDGYAVCLAEGASRFAVVGTVLAGQSYAGDLEAGQAVRIMTGAPCPKNTTVVPIERTDGGTEFVEIEAAALQPFRNIAKQGQDAKAGDRILAKGSRLGPHGISAAAMAGASEVACFASPIVAIVTTGDEIGKDGAAGVRNSNGPYLHSFCESLGVAHGGGHAADNEQALRATLEGAWRASDIIVSVGGVSMGSADLVPGAVESLGFERILHKVAMQPGKPVYLARHPDGTFFLGLPGNPVSVLVTAHLFLLPLIGKFWGGWSYPWQTRALGCDHRHPGKRRLFLPSRCEGGLVYPVAWNGSGDFYAAATGHGLVDLSPESIHKKGESLPYLPFVSPFGSTSSLLPQRTE